MEKMTIVVWRGVIVDYLLVRDWIGENEIIIPATSDEIRRYWDERKRDKEVDL